MLILAMIVAAAATAAWAPSLQSSFIGLHRPEEHHRHQQQQQQRQHLHLLQQRRSKNSNNTNNNSVKGPLVIYRQEQQQ